MKIKSPLNIYAYKIWVFLFVAFVMSGVFFGCVNEGLAVGLSPAIMDDIRLQAGEKKDLIIRVINTEESKVRLRLSARDFVDKDRYGRPLFVDEKDSVASLWLSFPASEVTVDPFSYKDVPVSVLVPLETKDGGYFTAVFFETLSSVDTTSSVGVTERVGTLLFMTIGEEQESQFRIEDFQLLTIEGGMKKFPPSFVYTVYNQGNNFIKVNGEVVIRNILGLKTATFDANPQQIRALPSGRREVQLPRGEGITPDGFFETVEEEWKYWAFGRYTAELTLQGEGGVMESESFSFWVVPWRTLALLAFLTGVLFGAHRAHIWYVRKYYRSRG